MAPATLWTWFIPVRILGITLFFTLFTSCYKDHLYVQQEWVDRNFLASTHVGTPDPRQDCPPFGQRLLIAWRFPPNFMTGGLHLVLTVRFWDNTEEVKGYKIYSTHGNRAINFFGQQVLTYQIQVMSDAGDVLETWEHHFWTKLIDIDRSKFSVSSQPMQGSVMETP